MAKIFYSTAGEGRGHATRVRAVVERLRGEHQIVIFAPDDAHDLLAPLYAADGVENTGARGEADRGGGNGDVRVERIPGPRFAYRSNGRISSWRTTRAAAAYLAALPGLVARLERAIDAERPDLVITDFEPALPRAARRRGVPFVSLDHQHFLVVSDFSFLPRRLQARALFLGSVVGAYYSGQRATIVSSFFFPKVRGGVRNVETVGPMLRPQVLSASPQVGDHLLVYVRKFAPESLLEALEACGREVRFYGVGEREPRRNIRFFPIDERRFVDDLASAHAFVTTAGNQGLGEALYLRKPVLAFPETNNAEQLIHAHFLAREGTGEWFEFADANRQTVGRFLERVEEYRARIVPERMNGNEAALAVLRRHLKPARKGAGSALVTA